MPEQIALAAKGKTQKLFFLATVDCLSDIQVLAQDFRRVFLHTLFQVRDFLLLFSDSQENLILHQGNSFFVG